jgi:hypothetical protein
VPSKRSIVPLRRLVERVFFSPILIRVGLRFFGVKSVLAATVKLGRKLPSTRPEHVTQRRQHVFNDLVGRFGTVVQNAGVRFGHGFDTRLSSSRRTRPRKRRRHA